MANSADPDQTPHKAASDQGLHCLQIVQPFSLGIPIWYSLTYLNRKWSRPKEFIQLTDMSCNVQKTYILTCASSEYSDKPAHSGSLTRIYTDRNLNSHRCMVSSCRQRGLWLDCANAQVIESSQGTHVNSYVFSCSDSLYWFGVLRPFQHHLSYIETMDGR